MTILGSHAYVADHSFGLQVIDISNPENPQIVGSVDTAGDARSVVISGSFAYVADYSAGLQVVDISNPESPFLMGTIHTPGGPFYGGDGGAFSVAVTGNNVLLADGASGLQILPLQCSGLSAVDDEVLDPELTNTPQMRANLSVHPNPFNPRTTISFSIQRAQNVELCIYDMKGRCITVLADRTLQTGAHVMDWQGTDEQGRAVPSGIYLLRLRTEESVTSEKMMLLK